jgi:hypothetical protein
MYLAQLVAGSVRLHGKLSYCEDDTFTFLSKRESHRSWCPDRESTVGVLRRNLMGILREGGTAWYMDCGGNGRRNPTGQVEGWYRDEGLMRNFAEMQRLARRRLDRADHAPSAQVAVLVSDASVAYQRQDAALCDALVFHQMLQLGPLGASFDTYRVEDLPLLVKQPWHANYRLWIFLGTLHVGQKERDAVERLKAGGRTLLWVYGCGLLTEDAISCAAMESLTGLRVAVRLASELLLINCFATGSRIVFGTERPVGPVVIGADPRATVGGWFVNTGDPGFLTRDFGGWRSVWSGAPAVPTAVLRHLARQAAVHVYVDSGDQVLSENGYLSVHAGSDGERTVRLPKVSNVADAVTGKPVALAAREFRAALRRGETGIWTIDELPSG